MDFRWKAEYERLASEFLVKHFGDWQGLTNTFPCTRESYPWGEHRPDVIDSRIPAKNNTEYHGLERYAAQYHVTAQYSYAYHHWLLAAFWRLEDMQANSFIDSHHQKAIEYCIKQALYNQELAVWSEDREGRETPKSSEFGLSDDDIQIKDNHAKTELERL